MRKVIDKNYFGDTGLRRYLSASRQNVVVLTDYSGMESYNGRDPYKNLLRSFTILSEFPRQVLVLRGTRNIISREGIVRDTYTRLIDHDQTDSFAEFCRQVARAARGDAKFEETVEAHARVALDHLERMKRDMAATGETITALATEYTPAELRVLRDTDCQPPSPLLEKVLKRALHLGGCMLAQHPDRRVFPNTLGDAIDSIVFRFALTSYLWALYRASNGAGGNMKAEKVRNDVVDLSYVAYATYFDGLLTRETMVNKLFAATCNALTMLEGA